VIGSQPGELATSIGAQSNDLYGRQLVPAGAFGDNNHANFAVDDIDAFVTQPSNRGWQLLSEVQFVAAMKLKTI
jgi:hypothetical protein